MNESPASAILSDRDNPKNLDSVESGDRVFELVGSCVAGDNPDAEDVVELSDSLYFEIWSSFVAGIKRLVGRI